MEADSKRIWTGAGWGDCLTWGARSAAGVPLVLSLRLPLGWTSAELIGADGPLAAWSKLTGAITAQRLELALARREDRGTPVLATEGVGTSQGRSLSVLVLRYMFETRFGGLAVTFSAPQAPVHEKLERVFDRVAQTISLEAAVAARAPRAA